MEIVTHTDALIANARLKSRRKMPIFSNSAGLGLGIYFHFFQLENVVLI